MAENRVHPDLRELFEQFAGQLPIEVPSYQEISRDQIEQPYHGLLVHEHHMTLIHERFHGRPVELRVLARVQQAYRYARMILLALEGTDQIVQFGIFRIDLRCCDAAVQAEILAGHTPLGRILIDHDVMRRIQPTAYLRITPTRQLCDWMGISSDQPLYGRLAIIFCDGQPAIELLEVVHPEADSAKPTT